MAIARRLAAILSADIAGYSRLMGEDEVATLRALKDRQAAVFPLVGQFDGRIIDVAGDGILAEFPSAIGAVQCALEIQRVVTAKNDEAPAGIRLQFRIGVNLGDVIHEGERIYGDGINVAARIQALAQPGGVVVSQPVFEQVRTRLPQRFINLGAARLKNIREPVIVHEAVLPWTRHRNPWIERWRFALGTNRALKPVLLVAALAFVALVAWHAATFRQAAEAPKDSAAATEIHSIAILPFRRVDAPTTEDEYLGVGIADALITSLGNVQQITVRPTSAVLRYNKPGQDPLAAGREQAVDALMEGTIQKSGPRLRLNVRLLRVRDGASLWAAKYDEDFSDVFHLQDSIAEQATRALLVRLTGQQRDRLAKRSTGSVPAYQLYMQGRYHWNKFDEPGFRKAISYYEQALQLDPGYALAYVGLGNSHSALVAIGAEPYAEGHAKARAASERAIALDDGLAEAHMLRGANLLLLEWNWDGAARELKRAIELNPNIAEASSLLGYERQARGKPREAVEVTRRGVELDPLSALLRVDLSSAYYYERQWDFAIREYEKALELDSNFVAPFFVLAQALERKGDAAGAIRRCEAAIKARGRDPAFLSALGYAHASAGHRKEASAIAREMQARYAKNHFNPTLLALLYAGLGERDRAIEWLERAYSEHDVQLIWFNLEPQADVLRDDARFADLMRRMGLATYSASASPR
jgi:class 3 adenylate cyclase/TolB-like protein/Flp pilus assembly protein TadD